MKPKTKIVELPQNQPDADSGAPQPTPRTYRAKGKIAALPKPQREIINRLLLDGSTYAVVIRKMAEEGISLNAENVSNWHNGPGYQRWLLDQDWREDIRADQEAGLDLQSDFDSGKFNEATLQVAITHLFRAFRHLGSTPIKDKLGGDVHNFARLVHALARAAHETLNLQKHRDATTKAAAIQLKNLDPDRDLSDNEYALLINKMDQVFKVARPKPPEPLDKNKPHSTPDAVKPAEPPKTA